MADTASPTEDVPPAIVEEEPQNIEKPTESPTIEPIKEPFENRTVELIHDEETLNNMTKEELVELYKNSITYINGVETKMANFEGNSISHFPYTCTKIALHRSFISKAEVLSLKNAADYQKHRDPSYREKVLLRKLAMKEQEIQEYAVCK